MKGTKELKTNKGITLIALIITIIVMLILVGVTISMAVNGGLFDYAGKATGETKNAINAEQELANGAIKVNGVWYDSIDDYLAGKKSLVTPTSITISGEDHVKVRETITLKALNQEGQEIPSNDIKWESSDTTIATVENGIVTGKKSSLDEDPEVTITATYIPNNTLVATKNMWVSWRECEECSGSGELVYCAECNAFYGRNSLVESGRTREYECGSCGTFVSSFVELTSCPECNSVSIWDLDGEWSFEGVYCPEGHILLEDGFERDLDRTGCETCLGFGYVDN